MGAILGVLCLLLSLFCFVLVYTVASEQVFKKRAGGGADESIASLYRHGALDIEKVLTLIEKEMPNTTVGIITETIPTKKPIDDDRPEVERQIFVKKPTDAEFFLCTTFFNLLPEYFTLQNELMFIESMGIKTTAQAYDKKSIDTLLNELNESKTVEDKDFYTNMLLDIKALQK